MKVILLVVMSVYGGDVAVTQEFDSWESCNAAKVFMEKTPRYTRGAVCIRK